MTKTELISFFEDVAKYYKIQLPDMKFYWEDLQDYLLTEVRQACREHRKDDKRGSYFPTVSDIAKRIKREKKSTFSCCIRSCEKAGEIAYGDLDNHKYLCVDHFENMRDRHDYQIEIEQKAKQTVEYAKQAGITCREMSLELAARNPKEKKMMDDMKLYAKLGGKN